MLPLYEGFRSQSENGKVMGLYPILKFPSPNSVRSNTKSFGQNNSQPNDPYGQQKVNFQ